MNKDQTERGEIRIEPGGGNERREVKKKRKNTK